VQLYPAIDVQGGYAARGDGEADPVATAQALAAAGISWVHVVDLDRALGTGRDDATVRAVIQELEGVRVQLGGGLIEPADIREAISWGVDRVVVGPQVLDRIGSLADLVERMLIAVACPHPATEFVSRAAAAGIRTVIVRDHEKDGTLSGANFDAAAPFLTLGVDVILAGGIASLDELRRARDMGFAGVIVGKALLTGRFTLAEAMQWCG
jgi:phosphoribosylformimino-5-aminoimidazole carboxamide ribonucleotide (ProFAR) isomerase